MRVTRQPGRTARSHASPRQETTPASVAHLDACDPGSATAAFEHAHPFPAGTALPPS
ncbi:hypothetical protein ABT352_30490 [Streptosporangium sp. NPDC000563]|uniref:hypothetical protein n=1 Tax=Streptosporangium sp. NPDC000563 TaxID=3154366 RepID=UPI0033227EF6